MAQDDRIAEVAGEWSAKADNDLTTAEHTLELGQACPTDTVCFHAQQCLEKYLKAALVLHRIEFPMSHDIEVLVALLPDDITLSMSVETQRKLTTYATVTRYPGDYEAISLGEARSAVETAGRCRAEIRRWLPEHGDRPK